MRVPAAEGRQAEEWRVDGRSAKLNFKGALPWAAVGHAHPSVPCPGLQRCLLSGEAGLAMAPARCFLLCLLGVLPWPFLANK